MQFNNKQHNAGERILELDLLRGLTIILVVIGHSFIVYPIDISQIGWCKVADEWIDTFHMEMFFVISGICYSCKSYVPYFAKKVKRLLVPYVVFGFITVLLHELGGQYVNNHLSVIDGLYKMLHGGNYWFLYTLFVIFLIYPLVERRFNTNRSMAILIIVLLFIGNSLEVTNMFQIKNILYHIPYFMVGAYLRNEVKKRTFDTSKNSLYISLLFFIIIEYIDYHFEVNLHILRYIRAFSMIYLFYAISVKIVSSNNKEGIIHTINSFLSLCSKYSLQIYLFNGFLLVAFRIIICNILHVTNPLVIVSGIVAGNIITTLLVCELLKRWRIARFLIGL